MTFCKSDRCKSLRNSQQAWAALSKVKVASGFQYISPPAIFIGSNTIAIVSLVQVFGVPAWNIPGPSTSILVCPWSQVPGPTKASSPLHVVCLWYLVEVPVIMSLVPGPSPGPGPGRCPWQFVVPGPGIGPWSLVPGPWSLVPGPWSLVLGPWSLVLGPWSLVPDPSQCPWHVVVPVAGFASGHISFRGCCGEPSSPAANRDKQKFKKNTFLQKIIPCLKIFVLRSLTSWNVWLKY